MSSVYGKVKFKDDTLLYCFYSGTSDIMSPSLHDKIEDIWDNHNCNTCDCEGEDVLIYHDYAWGETYTGKACREHKCITFDFNNYMESYQDPEYRWHSKYSKEEIIAIKEAHKDILSKNWIEKGDKL